MIQRRRIIVKRGIGMKKVMTCLVLAAIAVGVAAMVYYKVPESIPVPVNTHKVKVCRSIGNLADYIMERRQNGVSESDLDWEAISAGSGVDENENYVKMSLMLIQLAYEVPEIRGRDRKESAAREFGDKMFSICMKKK